MDAYIGSWGNLVGFPCPSSVEITQDRRSSFMTTLGGRVIEQRGPSPRRSWQVGIGVGEPWEIADLEALAAGIYGPPPWAWVSPEAASQNMMTPASSLLEANTYSVVGFPLGPRTAVDGTRIPRTVGCLEGDWVYFGSRVRGHGVPVMPGDVVTGSLYGEGVGSMSLVFQDETGVRTDSHVRQFSDRMERHHVTAVVPPGTAEAILRVDADSGAIAAGAPAITMTSGPMSWSVGKGCAKATVEGLDTAVLRSVPDSKTQNYSRYSFTVRELG